ncbi:alpha/beta fold hydrolase [Ruminococcus sp.]|uniref:alpha/beta fold hydrolase n=1 Tax=Ruminococcus sp. TaxID=41978 RepID=UPI0025DA5709|nr:alpha/beta fold hydrolase [Ruminococcus sp.]MBQ8965232.1 alpha/beta fold hydrolase [Ruminococcus sp.]
MKKALKVTGKILLWLLIVIVSLIAILFISRPIGKAVNDRTPDGGINETMYVDINGTKQWINIYGQDKDNPVLLYLHGGPCGATSWLDWSILRSLSEDYTVVGWDQRGFGHNYPEYKIDEQISADTMMQDGIEMTDYLRDHLGKDKITIMGISWGSIYAANLALEYPDRYDAVVAMSLVVDIPESQQRYKEWVLKQSANDPEMHKLAERFDPQKIVLSDEESEIIDKLDAEYGFTDDYFKDADENMYAALWFNPNCTLKEQLQCLGFSDDYNADIEKQHGKNSSNAFNMIQEMSLSGRTEYEVPFYLIEGRKDTGYINMAEEAAAYFDKVEAPDKEMFYVDGGHMAPMLKSKELSGSMHKIAQKNK